METERIVLDREEAGRLYREYMKARHYESPVDAEVKRAYRAIAKGQMIIRAIESIARAGVGSDGLPKLALCRADAAHCDVTLHPNGGAVFRPAPPRGRRRSSRAAGARIEVPADSFPRFSWDENRKTTATAIVPPCPLHLRPKTKTMEAYHILWEAEWRPVPPRDPMLLRRIGVSDMWIVLAHWDLTEVERAALATRV